MTFGEASGLLIRARNARTPPIPRSMLHLEQLLDDPMWRAWALASNTTNERFFTRSIHISGNALLFTNRRFVALNGEGGFTLFGGS